MDKPFVWQVWREDTTKNDMSLIGEIYPYPSVAHHNIPVVTIPQFLGQKFPFFHKEELLCSLNK